MLRRSLALPDSVEIGASRTLPGTINALVVTYYSSDEWHKPRCRHRKERAAASSSVSAPSMATSASRCCATSTS